MNIGTILVTGVMAFQGSNGNAAGSPFRDPGTGYADTKGLVKLEVLLHCTVQAKTGACIATPSSSKEDIASITAYNHALSKEEKRGKMPRRFGGNIWKYEDVVDALVEMQILHKESRALDESVLYDVIKKSKFVGEDPLVTIMITDLGVEYRDYSWVRKSLRKCAEKHPMNRILWLFYASKTEIGSVSGTFDPLKPPFDFAEAVRARQVVLKRWPDHYKSLFFLAQDLDFLGRKKEAVSVLEQLEKAPITDKDLIKRRAFLRAYFEKGGWQRGQ